MSIRSLCPWFLAASMLGATADAQSILPVNPAKIKAYATMWRVTVTRPDGSTLPQGLWSDQVTLGSFEGRSTIRRVQGMTYINGQSATWTNVLDASTMLPLTSVLHGQRGVVITRTYSDSGVRTLRTQPESARIDTVSTPLHGSVYDYLAGTYGLLFAALSWTDGAVVKFSSIDAMTDSIKTVEVKVTGRARVNAGNGRTAMAWTIVDGALTYYVAEETPYVLRLVEKLPNGATMSWDLP
jgi:hypothetical protein